MKSIEDKLVENLRFRCRETFASLVKKSCKKRKIEVSKFIRDAIREKVEREIGEGQW